MEIKDVRVKKDTSIGFGDIVTHKKNKGLFLVVSINSKDYPVMLMDLNTFAEENSFSSLGDLMGYELVAKSSDIELVMKGVRP